MEQFIDDSTVEAGGWTTVVTTLSVTLMEWFGEMTVNNFLQALMLIGSIIFLYYKIINARLDSKLKKKELKGENKDITK